MSVQTRVFSQIPENLRVLVLLAKLLYPVAPQRGSIAKQLRYLYSTTTTVTLPASFGYDADSLRELPYILRARPPRRGVCSIGLASSPTVESGYQLCVEVVAAHPSVHHKPLCVDPRAAGAE